MKITVTILFKRFYLKTNPVALYSTINKTYTKINTLELTNTVRLNKIKITLFGTFFERVLMAVTTTWWRFQHGSGGGC